MADRGLFFRAIARVSPAVPESRRWRSGWPPRSACVYVLLNDFQQLADKFILGIWPFYALAVAAVFVLRRTRPDLPRPYRTWGYPVVPLLFLLASVAMVLNALLDRSGEHGDHLRDHSGGDSGVLRVAGVWRAAMTGAVECGGSARTRVLALVQSLRRDAQLADLRSPGPPPAHCGSAPRPTRNPPPPRRTPARSPA